MNRNSFLGLDRFIWWVGVIVNRKDVLEVGRCQVRIFGWHTDDKQMLPDEDLPWATPLYSPNNTKSFESPKVGDWIFGFFMDGEGAQFPVYLGVFPYIVPQTVVDDDGFNPQPEDTAPESTYGEPQPGQSSLPLQAQGQVTNTGIESSDNDRIHVCDVCAKLNLDIAKEKLKQLIDVSAIRAEMKALFTADSSSPLVENVKDIVTTLKAQAKLVKQYTDAINEEISAVNEYVKYVEDTIKYIESLPAEAQKLLAGCLSDLKSSLKSVLSE